MICMVAVIALLIAGPSAAPASAPTIDEECALLLKDPAFSKPACARIFSAPDPLEEAAVVKCGNANSIQYSYWTDDDGIVVACAEPRPARKKKMRR